MHLTRVTSSLVLWTFIFPCIIAVSILVPTALYFYDFLDKNFAILCGILIFFCLFFIQRQSDMYRKIQILDKQILQLEKEQVTHKTIGSYVEELKEFASTASVESNKKHERTQTQLNTIDDRVFSLEQSQLVTKIDDETYETSEKTENKGASKKKKGFALPNLSLSYSNKPKSNDEEETAEGSSAEEKAAEEKAVEEQTVELSEESLTYHLQPVVSLPQRVPQHFETLLRLQIGSRKYLNDVAFTKLINNGNLWSTFDKKKMFSSKRILEKLNGKKRKDGLMCSLSSASLQENETFSDIFHFLENNQALSDQLTLTISQLDFNSLSDESRAHLASIHELGFRFCLNKITQLDFDPKLLESFGFAFIKVPAAKLLIPAEPTQTKSNTIAPNRIVTHLALHDILVIADHVERDEDALGLLDLDIELAQGSAFARSRAIKPELLDSTDPSV